MDAFITFVGAVVVLAIFLIVLSIVCIASDIIEDRLAERDWNEKHEHNRD